MCMHGILSLDSHANLAGGIKPFGLATGRLINHPVYNLSVMQPVGLVTGRLYAGRGILGVPDPCRTRGG